ncbi:MAG TPA: uracil-DNA glycosylase [Bacteroidota bacterium]|nr:uracil-DNA glycosylase [Bacteroidota bacterium]
MADTKEELASLISQTQDYLRMQQDLFGNAIFLEKAGKKPAAAVQAPGTMGNPDEPWTKADSLDALNGQICNCLKCGLGPTRTKFVFGVGNPKADIVFIGEGPGADEDRTGEPFVGRAGQLLNKILAAINLKREEVYICNIVKCRPPNNREPQPTEMETCTPYLYKQLELIKPKFIVCLGRIAAQWLLQSTETLGALRARDHTFMGAHLIVTYHPAALLRNESFKRPTWEDMKKLRKLYDESKAA